MTSTTMSPYLKAQTAIAYLKAAIHETLAASESGLRNADIGRKLGI